MVLNEQYKSSQFDLMDDLMGNDTWEGTGNITYYPITPAQMTKSQDSISLLAGWLSKYMDILVPTNRNIILNLHRKPKPIDSIVT